MPAAVDKPLVWLKGKVKTPPFSRLARIETGVLLRRLQKGGTIGMPHSRPMPSVGKQCHELRIRDEGKQWRLIYRMDDDAIVITEVFAKTTRATPKSIIQTCKRRLSQYDADAAGNGEDNREDNGEDRNEEYKAKKACKQRVAGE